MSKKMFEAYMELKTNEGYLNKLIPDKDQCIERIARKSQNALVYSKHLKKVKQHCEDNYQELMDWFKYPRHMRFACAFYRVLMQYHDDINSEDFNLLIGTAFELGWDDDVDFIVHNRINERKRNQPRLNNPYSEEERVRELKARGFVPLKKFAKKIDPNLCYLISLDYKLIYPREFSQTKMFSGVNGLYKAAALICFHGSLVRCYTGNMEENNGARNYLTQTINQYKK